MSGLPWFRFYSDFLTNPRIRLLDFGDRAHFVDLLCMKSSGSLEQFSDDPDMQLMYVAKTLEVSIPHASECQMRLMKVGLIDHNWQPLGWSERQVPSDSSAARTRMYRERKKAAKTTTKKDVTVPGRHSDGRDKNRVDKIRVDKTLRGVRPTKKCPADFEVSAELRAWAASKGYSPDFIQRQTEIFLNHEFKTARKDWPACWRNWLMRAEGYQNANQSRTSSPASDNKARRNKSRIAAGLPPV